jgi:hypothetical protein
MHFSFQKFKKELPGVEKHCFLVMFTPRILSRYVTSLDSRLGSAVVQALVNSVGLLLFISLMKGPNPNSTVNEVIAPR